jgi:hypothetical protein
MIGLRCMTDRRIKYLEELIRKYERYCSVCGIPDWQAHLYNTLIMQKVSKEYQKNFNFFKQHYVSHIITDIRRKGTTDNTSTRPGEGFQQEAAEAYKQTNKKQAENQVGSLLTHIINNLNLVLVVTQMVRIDENQEAIAHIRMAIDNDNMARTLQAQAGVEDCELADCPESYSVQHHWKFGSPNGTRLDSRELERLCTPTDRSFISFDERLRSFITHCFPEEAPHYEELIYVRF